MGESGGVFHYVDVVNDASNVLSVQSLEKLLYVLSRVEQSHT